MQIQKLELDISQNLTDETVVELIIGMAEVI